LQSVDDVANAIIDAEQNTTVSIEDIYDMALREKSYVDLPFLSHFLKLQYKEESDAVKFGGRLKAAKDLVLLDKMTKVKKS
jgi:ferritin